MVTEKKTSTRVSASSKPAAPKSPASKSIASKSAALKSTAPAAKSHEPTEMLTAETLPRAIGKLFELNNYVVEYGKKIHGAEVDIVATSKGDPFSSVIYVEATIQYVDNTKYGKDLTKFSMVQRNEPNCLCISVSTSGFTPDVKERAEKTGIQTKSYDELFAKFENFSPYISQIIEDSTIRSLVESYEEPYFRDSKGESIATSWLNTWKSSSEAGTNWLVILGEYGTGKTALTLKLQHDWILAYKADAAQPIPIRIELRNFTRQFDARSLIHHFLDKNSLGHIPIEFFFHLIRSRRVLLILDGYDEMAQFLNARERRACLAALADLSSDGAKGILTSRPNYFTETEELNVFEALYTSLEQNKYYISQLDRLYIAEERSVDALLENYLLNRNERYLRDLTPDQTKALVQRKLADDIPGQQIVLALLEKVFREEADGRRQALSGKPVIISYLLELIEELRSAAPDESAAALTEWQIYKLIVDRLMIRDLQRSPMLAPDVRRQALQRIATNLSGKENTAATEDIFINIIDDLFKSDLRRLTPEERRTRRDELFQDLRSSATLTRSEGAGPAGWVFSHNSLREYLVVELAIASVLKGSPIDITFPVSSAMRSFVASLSEINAERYLDALRELWSKRSNSFTGAFIALSFDLMRIHKNGLHDNLQNIFGKATNGGLDLNQVSLKNIELVEKDLGNSEFKISGIESYFIEMSFNGLSLSQSNFSKSTFDRVSFINCNLSRCDFKSSLIFECDLTGANVAGADFYGLDIDSNFIVRLPGNNVIALGGFAALGYLKFNGALTDPVDPYFELQHHSKFSIVVKICEHITDQRNSQLRGLTQRGAAQSDPPFARALVEQLKNAGLIEIGRNDLVSATTEGRRQLPRLVGHQEMPACIVDFLRSWQ